MSDRELPDNFDMGSMACECMGIFRTIDEMLASNRTAISLLEDYASESPDVRNENIVEAQSFIVDHALEIYTGLAYIGRALNKISTEIYANRPQDQWADGWPGVLHDKFFIEWFGENPFGDAS